MGLKTGSDDWGGRVVECRVEDVGEGETVLGDGVEIVPEEGATVLGDGVEIVPEENFGVGRVVVGLGGAMMVVF
jgi:hypothetical protein